MARLLVSVAIGLLCGIWEVAVSPFLPPAFSVHPLLPMLVIFVIASGRPRALAAAIAGGIMMDLFQPAFSDAATLRYALIVLLMDLASRHWFTNRSIYSAVALAFVGRLFERFSAWFVGMVMHLTDMTPYYWAIGPRGWIPFLWDAAFVVVGFLLIALLTKRFLTLAQHEKEF